MIHCTILLASSLLLAPETPTEDPPRDPDAEAPAEDSTETDAEAPAKDSTETDAETPPDSSDTSDASEAPVSQPQVADPAELPDSASPRPSTPANRPRRAELPPAPSRPP